MRIWQFLCGGLLVLNMTSCTNKQTAVETSTTTPTPGLSTAPEIKTSSGFAALQGVIGTTKQAIESGKLDVAKTEFAKFEASWKTVEDGVKAKSPDSYKAIENGVQSVESKITSKQDKIAVLADLQKLSQSIDRASK